MRNKLSFLNFLPLIQKMPFVLTKGVAEPMPAA